MKIKKSLFFPALTILIVVIVLLFVNVEFLQNEISNIYDYCIDKFGWFFILTNIICLVFSLWIMFGRYKNVRLGGDDAKPTFSTLSWAGMMFTTSCGAWLIVYGFLEPLYCAQDLVGSTADEIIQSFEHGQMYAHFHWGPNAWCIYVPITIAIGWVLYNRHEKKATLSSGCNEVLGKNKVGKSIGLVIDVIAIVSAILAPVISIGTGMPLLTALIENIFGIPSGHEYLIQIIILSIWIAIFGTSVFFGLQKGIKTLSNINISGAFVYMLIFGISFGLFNVFSSEINTIGLYFQNYIRLISRTDPFVKNSFVKGWTMGYWAVYFVYMPLMGVFNAKISKGRRLKDIAFGQLVLCTLGCWVAMATFGNYGINLELNNILDIQSYLKVGDEAGAILAILNQTKFPKFMMVFLLIISFIFLATTMDSSAFAAAEMTCKRENSEDLAPRWLRILWATVASVLAFAVLQVGGVKMVRSLCYIAGLPLAIITYVVIISVIKMLKGKKKDSSDEKSLNLEKENLETKTALDNSAN